MGSTNRPLSVTLTDPPLVPPVFVDGIASVYEEPDHVHVLYYCDEPPTEPGEEPRHALVAHLVWSRAAWERGSADFYRHEAFSRLPGTA